jgi:hypothetical protein
LGECRGRKFLVKTGTVITSREDGGIVGDVLTVPVFTGCACDGFALQTRNMRKKGVKSI